MCAAQPDTPRPQGLFWRKAGRCASVGLGSICTEPPREGIAGLRTGVGLPALPPRPSPWTSGPQTSATAQSQLETDLGYVVVASLKEA